METKKRERSANFTNAEVQLLVSLVAKHKQIIENKKTDAVTNKDKDTAWKKIETSFNSCGISTVERSWHSLKLKYEGVKKGTRKKSSAQRQEMYKTGGGTSDAPEFTIVEEKVMSICSNIQGLEARHDSDTILSVPSTSYSTINEIPSTSSSTITEMVVDFGNNAEELICADTEDHKGITAGAASQDFTITIPDMDRTFIINQSVNDHESQKDMDMDKSFIFDQSFNENDSQKENKWERWHPKALKSRVSKVLRPDTNKSSVSSKLDKLSSARLELVHLQMETARKELHFKEEEHKLKMEHMVNDEKRKQEIHAMLLQKLECASTSTMYDKL